MNKLFFFTIGILFFCSCEDKGDTEKFVGTWKVESYTIDREQLIKDSNWATGTIKILNTWTNYSNFGFWDEGHGRYKEDIYFNTEEKWISSKGWDMKFNSFIRFEKRAIVKLQTFENRQIKGVYEMNGNELVINGAEFGGRLHHIVLTRYTY